MNNSSSRPPPTKMDTANNTNNASFDPSVGVTQIPAVTTTTTKPSKRKAGSSDDTPNKKGKVETNSPPSVEVSQEGTKTTKSKPGKSGKSDKTKTKTKTDKTDKTTKTDKTKTDKTESDKTDDTPPAGDNVDETEVSTEEAKNDDDDKSSRLLVLKNVKTLLKTHDMRQSCEFINALEKEIAAMINRGIRRAVANKRKTLQPHDI